MRGVPWAAPGRVLGPSRWRQLSPPGRSHPCARVMPNPCARLATPGTERYREKMFEGRFWGLVWPVSIQTG